MPAAVQSGQAQGAPANEQAALAEVQNRGVQGNLLRGLLEFWDPQQILDALNQGHTPESLADIYRQRAGSSGGAGAAGGGAGAQPAGGGAAAKGKQGYFAKRRARRVVRAASWWDVFWPELTWCGLSELLWLANGLGTVLAVVPAVQAVIGLTWTISLASIHPQLPIAAAALFGVFMYLWKGMRMRSLLMTILVSVGGALLSYPILAAPLNATVIGWALGILMHLGISKTELLYWQYGLSWRVIPLFGAIGLDVSTSIQGALNLAYMRGWTWAIGDGIGAIPQKLLSWPGVIWSVFRARATAPAGLDPSLLVPYPGWMTRALVIVVLVGAVALFSERVKRYFENNFLEVWANRPFFRRPTA